MSRIAENRSRLRTTAYLGIVTLFGLPIISPLLRWASTPCTHDGHLYYHLITALGHTWENGLLFSRWMPDLAFGYGYPYFNFREAAPLYLALIPHQLGLSLPDALNLFYIVGVLAAGWFMFLWVRDLFGPVSGMVAAVAYMAAPYLLIDAFVRGNQPESIALALFPLLCWTGRRFMIGRNALPFAGTVLAYVLLALSHNISLLLFTPFLLLYLAFVGWLAGHPARRILTALALIFGLGLAISAFYVGPALLEMDQITIRQSVSTRNNDFRFNFATLFEMFAPLSPADPKLLNPQLLIRLGWITALLALLGVLGGFLSKSRTTRAHAIFMGLAAIFLLFMSTALSSFIWEVLPLIEFVQFPWRLIGRAALPLAFLTGIPFSVLPESLKDREKTTRLTLSLGAAAVILLILESTPYLYPHQCQAEIYPDINTVHTYERNSGFVGVDPEGSYFPKTVLSRPKESSLEVDYLAGEQPQRFDESSLPESAIIADVEYSPLGFHGRIDSPTPFQARYLTFDFPGWTAEVDSQAVPITPSDPEGLITFPIPAGAHSIEISWRMTPLRAVLTALSAAALIVLIAVTIYIFRRGQGSADENISQPQETVPSNEPDPPASDYDSWLPTIVVFLGAALLLIAFKFFIIDSLRTPFYRSVEPPVAVQTELSAEGLTLAGYTLDEMAVGSGDTFEIDLAWIADRTPDKALQTNLWLRGSDGHIWSEKQTFRPRPFQEPSPTTFWLPNQWAWDGREIEVLEGTPPGDYDIVLTLFDRSSLQPVTLIGAVGQAIGPEVALGRIEVTPSNTLSDQTPQYTVDVSISGLNLLGYNLDRNESVPGDQFLLTLFWSSDSASEVVKNELLLQLVDSAGHTAGSWKIPPMSESYPPSLWDEDLILRGQHSIRFGAHLASGDYLLQLENIPLGLMKIEAPVRLFSIPRFKIAAVDSFNDLIKLVGYSIDPENPDPKFLLKPNSLLTVELIWQALAEMPDRYRIFVHLIDETGQILDQSDGEPAGWTRPTTGWLPGEYIVDAHTLTLPGAPLPPGLALRIGIYNPSDGSRLMIVTDEFITVPLAQVDRDQ
jgi:hypothetical protein